jgi:hypothetical protein|tara:strand:- start:1544 stop:2089 length:546 start_codon:yes stop_codon:yes gene_type:complete
LTWHLYTPHTHDPNLGKVASVFLNEDKSLVKRYFVPGGITTHGQPTKESPEYVEEKWNNEVKALLDFQNFDWVPDLVEIDYIDRYIIQEYYGPCLLYQRWDDIPNLHQQIIDIYTYFKEIDVYKLNGSLANTTRKGDKLIMFDFKFMRKREPFLLEHAEREIDLWLKKFGQDLVPTLKALI